MSNSFGQGRKRADISSYSAQIHLHEPFAKPGSDQCTSALAILTASRAIVDSLHVITSTSFDVSLLDTMAFVSEHYDNCFHFPHA